MQNATDAIRARRHLEPDHRGTVRVELIEKQDGGLPTLLFSDDGVGLTEEEIHRFLATIGESSKRETLEARRNDFIGQFGIGLLSCFMVCDELLVVTRSAKGDGGTMEWRGRHDGTYAVRRLRAPAGAAGHPGLPRRPRGRRRVTSPPSGCGSSRRTTAACCPSPSTSPPTGGTEHLNPDPPPWRREYASAAERRAALLAYGREVFDTEFVDCIPLRAEAGQVEGVAFVLPFSPHFNARQKHRVYLKDMLLSESAENLLPEWAFFVKCVVNAQGLRPTASREAFYEDATLARARESLGQSLRQYLVDLATNDPRTLQRLIALHGLSVKSLALDDDDFFRLVIHWLPFETTLGMMTLGHYRAHVPHGALRLRPGRLPAGGARGGGPGAVHHQRGLHARHGAAGEAAARAAGHAGGALLRVGAAPALRGADGGGARGGAALRQVAEAALAAVRLRGRPSRSSSRSRCPRSSGTWTTGPSGGTWSAPARRRTRCTPRCWRAPWPSPARRSGRSSASTSSTRWCAGWRG